MWTLSVAMRDACHIGGGASVLSAGVAVANPVQNIWDAGKTTLLLQTLIDPTTPMVKTADGQVTLRRPGGASWVDYEQNTLDAGTPAIVEILNRDQEPCYSGAVGSDADDTEASVIDNTSYPVADQDGNNFTILVTGQALQTVTLSGATTTAAQVAEQANAQLKGVAVEVDGGQVKFTSDLAGKGVTIAAGVGTSGLTFDTPVDGDGAELKFSNGVTWSAASPVRTNAPVINQPADLNV